MQGTKLWPRSKYNLQNASNKLPSDCNGDFLLSLARLNFVTICIIIFFCSIAITQMPRCCGIIITL